MAITKRRTNEKCAVEKTDVYHVESEKIDSAISIDDKGIKSMNLEPAITATVPAVEKGTINLEECNTSTSSDEDPNCLEEQDQSEESRMEKVHLWKEYKPRIEGLPLFVQNNTVQITNRSLPCISVLIKHRLVRVLIDPAISFSFICNDIYNIYVQSYYTEDEISYTQNTRKKATSYCWWSLRRALVSRARISLPIKWNTTEGGVDDVIQLNLIEPNPGLINGYIVLGRDFYTNYLPLFCLDKNLLAVDLRGEQNLRITMETQWLTVSDHIPIADRRKGVVYFIDRYEKNHAYCRKNCRRRNHRRSCFSSGTDENNSEEDIAAYVLQMDDAWVRNTVFITTQY